MEKKSLSYSDYVDHFFTLYFKYNPSEATASGFHQYDSQLEKFSTHEIDAEITAYKKLLEETKNIDFKKLDLDQTLDIELIKNRLQGKILALKNIRAWEKQPDFYATTVSNSIFLLMSRNFAPAKERMKSVIAREKQALSLIAEAKKNLKHPPKIFSELALESLGGQIEFFRQDVPEAFSQVTDKKLKKEFEETNHKIIAQLTDYKNWIKNTLLPKAQGDFRLGADNFKKMLLYNEMVDVPLEHLLEIGYSDLRSNQQKFAAVAKKINPALSREQVVKQLEHTHPAANELINIFRETMHKLEIFLQKKELVTIPPSQPPFVIETPLYARALTFAAMETPGPYDAPHVESFFEVSPPDPKWPKEIAEDYLASFNQGSIITTTAHEVYPGHYTQYLWMRSLTSKVRKLIGAESNSEGWAHYSEQMVVDEGYDPNDLYLRLGQLQDALLRNARYIVSIQMHTGNMTLEEAKNFFIKEAYLTPTNALLEAKRGTNDPNYLSYTLGKLQILKLRADYKKLKGKEFTLKNFHDAFLKEGYPPIKIVRIKLLGRDQAEPVL